MRFPKVEITRRIDKQTLIWVHPPDKEEIIIIDPGHEGGDIHIYKKIGKKKGSELAELLQSMLGTRELDPAGHILDVMDVGDAEKTAELIKNLP